MDKEQKIQDIERRAKLVQAAGYNPANFFPWADLYMEIWPDNHPFIEERFAMRSRAAQGDFSITDLSNPFEGKGALLSIGRQGIRFVVNEEGLNELIELLEDVKVLLARINDPEDPLNTSDIPMSIDLKKYNFSMPELKVFSQEEDIEELKGGKDRRNLSLTEILKQNQQSING